MITSPNYPQDYAPNLNCSWHVVVTSGFIIAVHFEQPFQVKSEDTSCSLGDYVEVRLFAKSPNLKKLLKLLNLIDFSVSKVAQVVRAWKYQREISQRLFLSLTLIYCCVLINH